MVCAVITDSCASALDRLRLLAADALGLQTLNVPGRLFRDDPLLEPAHLEICHPGIHFDDGNLYRIACRKSWSARLSRGATRCAPISLDSPRRFSLPLLSL